MIVGRIIGIILILMGLAVAGRDTLASLSLGKLEMLQMGQFWFELHAGSLNALQAGVERYIAVWLWDGVIQPMLLWPASVFPLLPGILLFMFCKPRSERRAERRFFRRKR